MTPASLSVVLFAPDTATPESEDFSSEPAELALAIAGALVPRPSGALNELHTAAWDFARSQRVVYRADSDSWQRFVWRLTEHLEQLGLEDVTERDVLVFALSWLNFCRARGVVFGKPYTQSNGLARLAGDIVRQAKLYSLMGRANENPYVQWCLATLVCWSPESDNYSGFIKVPRSCRLSSREIAQAWRKDYPGDYDHALSMDLSAAISDAFRPSIAKGYLKKNSKLGLSRTLNGWLGLSFANPARYADVLARAG